MKLEFYNARNGESNEELLQEDRLVFAASRPAIIHSTETVKIQTDLIVKVPSGYVLNISTSPELHARLAEMVPGLMVVSHLDNEKPLEFMVRNSGRNTLTIQPKQSVAVGFVIATEVPEIAELEREPTVDVKIETEPVKKRPTIKFEIR